MHALHGVSLPVSNILSKPPNKDDDERACKMTFFFNFRTVIAAKAVSAARVTTLARACWAWVNFRKTL